MDGRGSGSGAAPFPTQIPSLHAEKLPYSCVLIYGGRLHSGLRGPGCVEENNSCKVLSSTAMDQDKQSQPIINIPVLSPYKIIRRCQTLVCVNRKSPTPTDTGCEMAAAQSCRCYCSIKRSLSKCLRRLRRLEV